MKNTIFAISSLLSFATFTLNVDSHYIFLAEPQIWYHIADHFDFGGEIELSNNFALVEGFKVRPTVAVKWKF